MCVYVHLYVYVYAVCIYVLCVYVPVHMCLCACAYYMYKYVCACAGARVGTTEGQRTTFDSIPPVPPIILPNKISRPNLPYKASESRSPDVSACSALELQTCAPMPGLVKNVGSGVSNPDPRAFMVSHRPSPDFKNLDFFQFSSLVGKSLLLGFH